MATHRKLPTETLTDDERATWQMPIAQQPAPQLPAPVDEDDEEETASDRVAALLGSSLEDDKAFVKVQRVIGPNKYAHCDQYSIADYENGGIDMIRDQWGPGEYDIRLYGSKPETGKFGVRAKAMITILAKRGEELPAARANSELSQVLQTIAQSQQQMLKALTEKPTGPDPMQQFQQMMLMMSSVKDVFGVGNESKSQLKDIVAAMREMKEVSAEFAPDSKKESDDDSPMKMLLPMLEIIKGAQGQPQQAAPQQMPPVRLPAPTQPAHQPIVNPAAQPVAQTAEDENVDIGAIALFGHLRRMATMAQTNVDPKNGAEVLYDKLPDEFIDLMASTEWFELLSQVAPFVAPYKEWMTKARDGALAMFAEDSEEPVSPDGSGPAPC